MAIRAIVRNPILWGTLFIKFGLDCEAKVLALENRTTQPRTDIILITAPIIVLKGLSNLVKKGQLKHHHMLVMQIKSSGIISCFTLGKFIIKICIIFFFGTRYNYGA